MKKILKTILILLLLLSCFNFKDNAIKATTSSTKGNQLTLNAKLSEQCAKYAKIAGEDLYALTNGEYTVFNSNNEAVGVFVLDKDGVGIVKGTNETTMFLADGTYSIRLTKNPDCCAITDSQQVKYVTLTSHTPKPSSITVNTITALYGKNSSGNYFSNNQYKLWSTTYGTGIFECGIAEVDSPCSIDNYGSHSLNVSDAIVLDRNSITDAGYPAELIYKIMYYGRSGPAQWSGFSKYYTPFMSRNGSTQYTGGYSGKEALAAFITHVALSRAWGQDKGKWSLQSNIAGFSQFWSYVTNTENAPEDFVVYVWQHSKTHSDEQDMFFGYTLEPTDYDKQAVTMELNTNYDPISTVLTKIGSDNEPIAKARYTIKYYNTVLENVDASKNVEAVKTWTFETDDNGYIRFNDWFKVAGDDLYPHPDGHTYIMLPGTYIVSETYVPEGYIKSDDFMIRVTTNIPESINYYAADGKTLIHDTLENGYLLTELKESYLSLQKSSSSTLSNSSLKGAIYNVYTDQSCNLQAKENNSEKFAVLTINEDGSSNKVGLIPGKYYVKEVYAPLGYLLNPTIYEVDLTQEETIILEVCDDPILYKVKKVDIDGNIVENANIELYHNNELLTTFVTSKEATDISSYLTEGESYRLHEISAPAGYLISDDVSFTVNAKKDEFTIITMTDEYQPTIKTTASFSNGNKYIVESKVTVNDLVHIEKLVKDKKYTVKGHIYDTNDLNSPLDIYEQSFIAEDSAMDLNADFDITVEEGKKYVVFEYLYDDNGNLISSHQDANDSSQIVYCPLTTKIKVIKCDETNTDKHLSDCEITVFNIDGSIAIDAYGDQAIKTTDKNGEVEFVLFSSEQGYYVQETKAPKGYKLNSEKYAITEEITVITIDDGKIPDTGDVCIQAFSCLSLASAITIYFIEKKKRSI